MYKYIHILYQNLNIALICENVYNVYLYFLLIKDIFHIRNMNN